MSSINAARPFPGIPEPGSTPESHRRTIQTMKQILETLTFQGTPTDAASVLRGDLDTAIATTDAVRYGTDQNLTSTQTLQARDNIGLYRDVSGLGIVTPLDYGAVGDGVADDTTAVLAAVATGKHVDLRGLSYLVSSQITFSAFQWMMFGTIVKNHTGDGMDMSAQQSGLFKVNLDCNSKNGRGVIIGGDGTVALHRQVIIRSFITNSVGYALEFTDPHSGGIFSAHDCSFSRTNSALMAIKLPADTLGTFAGRWFHNTQQGGNAMIDMSGAIGTRLIGGNTIGMTWDADTQYTYIENFRLAGAYDVDGGPTHIRGCQISGPLTLAGTEHLVSDNTMQGGSIVLDSGLTHSEIHVCDAVLTDNTSGQLTNRIYGHSATMVPVWGSTGVAPAIGDGTLAGSAANEGHVLKLRFDLTFGAGTTIGTGAWKFTAPAPFNRPSTLRGVSGLAAFFDSSTNTLYSGVALMNPTSPDIVIAVGGPAGSANFWGGSGPVPVTPAVNDALSIDITINYGV